MLERGKMDRNVIELVGMDSLVPKENLLQKIDLAVDFNHLYKMVEPLYCEDNGRPSVDPVALFKAEKVSLNIAYCLFWGAPCRRKHPTFPR